MRLKINVLLIFLIIGLTTIVSNFIGMHLISKPTTMEITDIKLSFYMGISQDKKNAIIKKVLDVYEWNEISIEQHTLCVSEQASIDNSQNFVDTLAECHFKLIKERKQGG